MNTLEVFGRTVKQVREDREITQYDLARVIGIAQPSLVKIEQGKMPGLSLKHALLISKFLNIKLDKLPVRFQFSTDLADDETSKGKG